MILQFNTCLWVSLYFCLFVFLSFYIFVFLSPDLVGWKEICQHLSRPLGEQNPPMDIQLNHACPESQKISICKKLRRSSQIISRHLMFLIWNYVQLYKKNLILAKTITLGRLCTVLKRSRVEAGRLGYWWAADLRTVSMLPRLSCSVSGCLLQIAIQQSTMAESDQQVWLFYW